MLLIVAGHTEDQRALPLMPPRWAHVSSGDDDEPRRHASELSDPARRGHHQRSGQISTRNRMEIDENRCHFGR